MFIVCISEEATISIRSKVLRGSMWISAGTMTTNILTSLSTIILARLLVPEDFGLVALGTSILAVVEAFTALSMSQALIQTKEPEKDHFNTAWTLGMIRGIMLFAVLAALAPFLASSLDDPRFVGLMLILASLPLISSFVNPKLVVFQKKLSFSQDALLKLASSTANVFGAIIVGVIWQSYWALVVGLVASRIVLVFGSYLYIPYLPALSLKRFHELWSFSAWMSLGQIVSTLNYRSDELLVGILLGKADLGLYTVGSKIAKMPGNEAVRPLVGTLFPAFTITANEPARLKNAYKRTQTIVSLLAMPASVGFAVVADPAVRLMLGDKWLGAIPVIQIIAIVAGLRPLAYLSNPLGMALGNTRLLFVRNAQKLAIRLPMIIAGGLLGGLYGLLIARASAALIGVLIDMSLIRRFLGVTILRQLLWNGRAITSTLIMAAAVYAFQHVWPVNADTMMLVFQLISSAALGAVIYALLNTLMWFAARRPHGPEREVLDVSSKAYHAVRTRLPGGGTADPQAR